MAPTAAQISQWLRTERERGGHARRAASVLLDVAEKTIERWEDPEQESLPDADQFLALVVFYKSNIMQFLARKVEPKGAATSDTTAPERKRKLG